MKNIPTVRSTPKLTTPSIKDVEHVVILMQENRSFDHYYGTLPGVRGYGDPRPFILSNGYPVWYQPTQDSSKYVLPYRPLPEGVSSNSDVIYHSLDHSWETTHLAWNKGNYDHWVPNKSASTMSGFNALDIPYYHALAKNFTICDQFYCSLLGPTTPNRYNLWTGCNGNVTNSSPHIDNSTSGCNWTTFPERLVKAGVSWKVYQDKGRGLDADHAFGEGPGLNWSGNYGDNSLLIFDQYQEALKNDPTSPLMAAYNATEATEVPYQWSLFQQLQDDVSNKKLSKVSWIVAPFAYCEHPWTVSSAGEWYLSKVLEILTSNADTWAKTALFVLYDENDGFFDHVTPPIPPALTTGKSSDSIKVDREFYNNGKTSDGKQPGDAPFGLGPRVPMLVISPWSRGGKVNSEVFDHTSVIRFIETCFSTPENPVYEPNITDWRRAICGDLTSAFDFSRPDTSMPLLPLVQSNLDVHGAYSPNNPPAIQALPIQPSNPCQACPLPYKLLVTGSVGTGFTVNFENNGRKAIHAQIGQMSSVGQVSPEPRFYTVDYGDNKNKLSDTIPLDAKGYYDVAVYGPNGSLWEFRGNKSDTILPEVYFGMGDTSGNIDITLDNSKSSVPVTITVFDIAYGKNAKLDNAQTIKVDAKQTKSITNWVGCSGWYDVGVLIQEDVRYFRRAAGCVNNFTGPSFTDPAIGNSEKFVPCLAVQGSTPLRFNYVTPPWMHRPGNKICVYKSGETKNPQAQVSASRNVGSTVLSDPSENSLPSGNYDAYLVLDDGKDSPVAGPVKFAVNHATEKN